MPDQPLQPTLPRVARVEVDRDLCISAASCVALAPKTFALDDEGKVKLLDERGDEQEMIIEAARSCPVDAIKLFDETGKQIWPKSRSAGPKPNA